jgi:hypothetical protein
MNEKLEKLVNKLSYKVPVEDWGHYHRVECVEKGDIELYQSGHFLICNINGNKTKSRSVDEIFNICMKFIEE